MAFFAAQDEKETKTKTKKNTGKTKNNFRSTAVLG
jgi:hypothetical protein